MEDAIAQLYTIGELRVGDKLCVGVRGDVSIDRAGTTQLLWRALRRDNRSHTTHALQALCIRVQAIMFEDMAMNGTLNDTLRVACLAGVAGLRTLGGTYRIGDTDGETADAILRIAFVLSSVCRESKKNVSTQSQTLPTPLPALLAAAATSHPPLPPSPPPVGKSQPSHAPMMFGRANKRRGAGIAAKEVVKESSVAECTVEHAAACPQ